MNILYVAPDIPMPHMGELVGGSTHVMKIVGSLAKKGSDVIIMSRRASGDQKKYERIGENIFTRRVYRGLIFPIQGKISSKAKEKFLYVFRRIQICRGSIFIYHIII